MDIATRNTVRRPQPTFAELFTPKLVTILREGYTWGNFRADAIAGLTVAIVALPLSMAIGIGSGLSPDKGLYTAIVGGFLISALGGSRFQIGGPAGAFIVLIAVIVERHGYDGLVLATLMAGLMMMALGFLRLGAYIKYIPLPVISGAFFFGATAAVSTVLDHIGERPKVFVLDFTDVPLADSTAAKVLEGFVHKLRHGGTEVFFTGARKSVRRTLLVAGLRRPFVHYAPTVEDAIAQARTHREKPINEEKSS